MAEITAKMVNELRSKSGQGMMECKKALGETGGDVEKAIELFRKRGVKTSVLAREAREGRVATAVAADGSTACAIEVLCNTDFTARSEPVNKAIEAAFQVLSGRPDADVAEDPAVKELITQAAQQTGENVQIGRTPTLKAPEGGRVYAYQHYTGKVAVLVALAGNPGEELMKDLCLHITATRPLALDRDSVPADVVAKEREIAVEQAKATGKPQEIAEKIAEGKMRTFYEERVLLDQKFVKDDSRSIQQLLDASSAKLTKYVRVEIGQ
jgi:elongation factor Ts